MLMALAAVYGAKALGGVLQGLSANKQAKAQNRAAYLNNQRMLLQAGQQANQAYAQMGSLSSQATGLQAEAYRQAQLQSGQQEVLANAAGTFGSSVQAVQNDIQHSQEVGSAEMSNDLETQLNNIRSQATAAFSSAVNNLDQGVKTHSTSSIFGNALVNAGVSTAADYLGTRWQFGASRPHR